MGLSGCPLVLKGVMHAFYSCKEPSFAQGRVCRSLRLLQRPVTQQPHDNIDPRRCHCVPCLGGLSPMKAAPTFGAGERRSPRWLRTPGVQKKRPQSCLEVSELPRSLRAAASLPRACRSAGSCCWGSETAQALCDCALQLRSAARWPFVPEPPWFTASLLDVVRRLASKSEIKALVKGPLAC